MIDLDEQEGPAQFMIRRLASADSSIVAGRPIPVRKLRDAVDKIRGGGDDRDRDKDRRRDSDDDQRRSSNEALMAELLVPGFGEEEITDELILGFGPNAEMMTATVTDSDREEARRSMERYDKNKNQYVDQNEISSRFAGNPLDFDRNRDGRLSLEELAVRYARRREVKQEDSDRNKKDDRRDRSKGSSDELPDLYNGRRSYRTTDRTRSSEGLPGYFTEQDRNGDGQVSMAEFMPENPEDWSDEELAKFFDADFNEDGIITASESLRSVEEGPASSLRAGAAGDAVSSSVLVPSSASTPVVSTGPIDQKYIDLAKRIISRRDSNKDGALTASEWKTMLMSPAAADANRDGRITAEEYARWTKSRESGR